MKIKKEVVKNFQRGDVFYLELFHEFDNKVKIEFRGNAIIEDAGENGFRVKTAKRKIPCLIFDNYDKTWTASSPEKKY